MHRVEIRPGVPVATTEILIDGKPCSNISRLSLHLEAGQGVPELRLDVVPEELVIAGEVALVCDHCETPLSVLVRRRPTPLDAYLRS